jgi:hypothetical protein
MKKQFSEIQVKEMINKAVLDSKIKVLTLFKEKIEKLHFPVQEDLEYVLENGWTRSENFIRLQTRAETLDEIKRELDNIVNFLNANRIN